MTPYETIFQTSPVTRTMDTIIIHCSATRQHADVTIDDIRNWHIQERHFLDIGYHFVIDEKGRIFTGRPLNHVGAHCKGHNAHSIGICYIGGLNDQGEPADTRTPMQKLAIRALIALLINEFSIRDVYGHRDLSPDLNGDGIIEPEERLKQCPCYDAHAEWLDYLRELAQTSRDYLGCALYREQEIPPDIGKLCAAARDFLEE